MKLALSTSAGYAIHALHFIAGSSSDEPVMTRQISEAYDIPYDSTLKILRQLAKAGLVEAHRGSQGGFTLSKSPSKISLLDIVVAIDGPIDLTDPLPKKSGDARLRRETDKLLRIAMQELRNRLGKTSLADL